MKTNPIKMRIGLGGIVVLLALGVQLSTAQGAHFLYTGGHGLDSTRLATFGGNTFTQVAPGFGAMTDALWQSALAGGFGPFDAIVVGEGTPIPSSNTRIAIANYVLQGGRIIVISGHGHAPNDSAWLNAGFGFSTVVAQGCLSGESFAGNIEGGASGTSFAGGPGTLFNGSCTTHFTIASRPAGVLVMYGDASTDIVWAREFGNGVVVWLGWDYCCTSAFNADLWYEVMNSALLVESGAQQINDLMAVVNGMSIPSQEKSVLIGQLREGINAERARPCDPTILSGFINEVNKARNRGQLTSAQANQLINAARAIKPLVSC